MRFSKKKFIKSIEREEKDFLKAPIYLYGTEAIGSYYKALNLEEKSVLTINGSGDQVLNAYFFGAKRVVGFDLVKNTHYMLNLKIAAIKKIGYKMFLAFFGNKDKIGNLNHATYILLKQSLDDETIEFFDTLFKRYKNNGKKLLESKNFRKRREFYVKLGEINPFLASEQNYQKMQKIIVTVKPAFIKSDIYDIHKKTSEKFDVINLSNVLNYVSKKLEKEKISSPIEHINRKILLNLRNMLKIGGKVIYYYFYRSPEEIETTPLVNRESSIAWLRERRNFTVSRIEFKGILYGTDAVVVLGLPKIKKAP